MKFSTIEQVLERINLPKIKVEKIRHLTATILYGMFEGI